MVLYTFQPLTFLLKLTITQFEISGPMTFKIMKVDHIIHIGSNEQDQHMNIGTIRISTKAYLSRDVASGSDKMPCNKIDKPLVVYRFSNVT